MDNVNKFELKLEGTPTEQQSFLERAMSIRGSYKSEMIKRQGIYDQRRDFYEGDQVKYTNIFNKTGKQKTGHVYPVFNYAASTADKLQLSLVNYPPTINIKPLDVNDPFEVNKAQMEETFLDRVLYNNKFKYILFPRGANNQSILGNFVFKTYLDEEAEQIRIVNMEKPEKVGVMWRGDDVLNYDLVWVEMDLPVSVIERIYGIKAESEGDNEVASSASGHEDPYNTRSGSRDSSHVLRQPDGKGKVSTAKVIEVCDSSSYGIIMNEELVHYVKHDYGFNMFDIGHNRFNNSKSWSKSDLDDIMDAQVELNERSGDEADMIRAGANLKYVAVNMPEFDAESVKSGESQVIYIDGEGADFRTLRLDVQVFPSESYLNRVMDHMYNLGIPRVAFATGSGQTSGRALSIEYQSVVEKIQDKRNKWELMLISVLDKVRRLAFNKWGERKEFQFLLDKEGNFADRMFEFGWDEIEPISRSDRVVDVLNLYNAGVWPLRKTYMDLKEKDPGSIIEMLKEEWSDPELSAIRSKQYEMTIGILEAQARSMEAQAKLAELGQQPMGGNVGGAGNVSGQPTLKPEQSERRMVNPAGGGVGSVASREGAIDQVAQNQAAAQGG